MEKQIKFFVGFNKRAASASLIGTTLGGAIGSILANKKNTETMESFLTNPKKVDAREAFDKIKNYSKGTKLVTRSELNTLIDKQKTISDVSVLQAFRDALEHGNAMALHPEMARGLEHHLPKEFRNKKVIFSADKVHPTVLAHEVGHIIDFEELKNSSFFKRLFKKHLRSTVGEEEAAWGRAPGEIDETIKEDALNTYKRARNWPILGILAGGLAGAGIDLYRKSL